MKDDMVPEPVAKEEDKGCLFYILLCLGAVLLTTALAVLGAFLWARWTLNASHITPTQLSAVEQQVLDTKLETIRSSDQPESGQPEEESSEPATPENKTLVITEKEINALLASSTELEESVLIDLRRNAVRARWNFPIPQEVPKVGGRRLRGQVDVRVKLEGDALDVRIDDVTVGGLSLPNAWLAGVKGVNLVQEYFGDDPALTAFTAGIKSFEIRNDELRIVLEE